jgi:YrbI family 3-deoxy-D-manno-octulosonate 8-phosphate phosphatase
MNVCAIIPARGGSKGLPRKNVTPIAGVPLIARTVNAAKAAALVTRVVVSTDDREIETIARAAGADIITRPASLSTDTSSSESALLHCLETLQSEENYLPELIVFLQATSPFTLPEDIDSAIQTLLDEHAETAHTVTSFHGFLWRQGEDGRAEGVNHDAAFRARRQDRSPEYLENGAVYVMRTAGFIKAKHRFFGVTALSVMPLERSLEIDTASDLHLAEAIAAQSAPHTPQQSALPNHISAVVLDFDGVFTDNKVLVMQDGTEAVVCSRGDGMGISLLRDAGILVTVISTEENPVVEARCRKLKLEVQYGVRDKKAALEIWAQNNHAALEDIVYLGNDINDRECLNAVGCGIVVADAHPGVKRDAKIVLHARGGDGAIRELVDLILEKIQENAIE